MISAAHELAAPPGARYVHPQLKGDNHVSYSNIWTECQENPLTFYVPDLANYSYNPAHNPAEADFLEWIKDKPYIPQHLIQVGLALNVDASFPKALTTYSQQLLLPKLFVQLYMFDDLMEELMSDDSLKDLRNAVKVNTAALSMGQKKPFDILATFGKEFPTLAERLVQVEDLQEDVQADIRRVLPEKVLKILFEFAELGFASIHREAPLWKRRLEPGFNVTFDQYVDVKRWGSFAAFFMTLLITEDDVPLINQRSAFVQIMATSMEVDNDIISYFKERDEGEENPCNLVRKHMREGQTELEALQTVTNLRNEQVKMMENMYVFVPEEMRLSTRKVICLQTGGLNYGFNSPRFGWSRAD
ncbi:hypothetical protein BGX28_004300 [Mortierella sp. GBA30]|nr:hypothetical protein BGX28_004300 [Mortierella sp. GBA30]